MTTLALCGDVMLGRGVNEALREMRPEDPWGDVLAPMRSVDLRIVNLECAITSNKEPWARTPKTFHFRADPSAAVVLRAARIDACSLANNHVADFEEEGLLDTIAHLDDAGIAHAGAGRNPEEAARPALLDSTGAPVALLAFTDNEPSFAAERNKPGTNYLPVSMETAVLRRVEEAVEAAREAGAKTVVFSNHWGPNMVERPPKLFRRFAHAVIDRGADVYYGHSAHVFQGVELYRGRPIFYDTGDFIDDYAVNSRLRNDRSFLFLLRVERGSLVRVELFPVNLRYARVRLARGTEQKATLDRMEALSAEMGTVLGRRDDRLVVEP